MTDKRIVLSTCPSHEEALRIAKQLVEEQLAACVNISAPVTSIYRWQGALEQSEEVMLVIKSREHLFGRLRQRLAELHSYDVPEVVAIPVTGGLDAYMEWWDRETVGPEIN